MASVVAPAPSLTPAELQKRRRALDSSLGTTMAEGVSPSPAALALGEKYGAGEIDLEEYLAAVKALHQF